MNRTQKIALLTKVLQGEAPRQRLRQAVADAPRSLVIIDDLDEPGKGFSDSDRVYFQDRGTTHQMSLGEAKHYANRYGIGTLFILPEKK